MAKKAGKRAGKTAAQTVTRKRSANKKPAPISPSGPRRLKQPVKLPSAWRLTRRAATTLWRHRKIFIGITLIYGLLNLILVQGLGSSTDVSSLKNELNQVFTGHFGALASGLGVFVVMLGSAGNSSSPTAGAYQLILILVASLAIIWALRQVAAGSGFRIRDAYYRGMYPLVPFTLVLVVIGLQLLPLILGATVYSIVISNGIAIYTIEKLLFALLFIALAVLSLYLLSSSLFGLYIVTLPDMTPLKALRSARELSRHRRWTALRKILGLPVILLIVAAIIMVPIIIWLTPLTRWVFFILTMFAVTAVHSYMYTLYREMLNE